MEMARESKVKYTIQQCALHHVHRDVASEIQETRRPCFTFTLGKDEENTFTFDAEAVGVKNNVRVTVLSQKRTYS